MMTFDDVLSAVQPLASEELELWIERRWVLPDRHAGEYRFGEVDIARIRMIHDIRHTLEVATDTIPVMLSLIDQLYAARRRIHGVMKAIDALPPEFRQTILESIDSSHGKSDANAP